MLRLEMALLAWLLKRQHHRDIDSIGKPLYVATVPDDDDVYGVVF